MKTLFALGFQASYDLWDRRTVAGTYLGRSQPRLGIPLTGAQVDEYTRKITQGRQKLAQLRSWMAARTGNDPTLTRTFNDPVVEKNFWDFIELVTKDQYYVDRVWEAIQNPTGPEYDIPENDLAYVDEWAQVIDNLMYAPQNYGGGRPAVIPGAVPGTTPGAALRTPPKQILGVAQDTFVLGAGALAIAGILTYALVK